MSPKPLSWQNPVRQKETHFSIDCGALLFSCISELFFTEHDRGQFLLKSKSGVEGNKSTDNCNINYLEFFKECEDLGLNTIII